MQDFARLEQWRRRPRREQSTRTSADWMGAMSHGKRRVPRAGTRRCRFRRTSRHERGRAGSLPRAGSARPGAPGECSPIGVDRRSSAANASSFQTRTIHGSRPTRKIGVRTDRVEAIGALWQDRCTIVQMALPRLDSRACWRGLRVLLAFALVIAPGVALAHESEHVLHRHDGPCVLHVAADHLVIAPAPEPAPATSLAPSAAPESSPRPVPRVLPARLSVARAPPSLS